MPFLNPQVSKCLMVLGSPKEPQAIGRQADPQVDGLVIRASLTPHWNCNSMEAIFLQNFGTNPNQVPGFCSTFKDRISKAWWNIIDPNRDPYFTEAEVSQIPRITWQEGFPPVCLLVYIVYECLWHFIPPSKCRYIHHESYNHCSYKPNYLGDPSWRKGISLWGYDTVQDIK